MELAMIDKWANFLANEKLQPASVGEQWTMELVRLCEALAAKRGPRVRPYLEKLASRRLVVDTAMDLGIDLPAIRGRTGRLVISRSLLDAWNLAYREWHGSTVGTASVREAKRRDIKTRLCREL
jgi:hypothetical protein